MKTTCCLLATFGLCLLTVQPARAESVAEQWVKRFNNLSNVDDSANAVAVDAGGNVIITGFSNGSSIYDGYYTAKYAAADGSLIWEKRSPQQRIPGISTAVAVDGSNNVIVTGYAHGAGNAYYYYTAKYAAVNGSLIWETLGPAGSARALALDACDLF